MRFALPLEIIRRHGAPWRPKPYVEKLISFTAAAGWDLQRLEPQPDVIDANSVGTRGIKLWFWLEPGIYRALQHMSHYRDRIIYLHVRADGTAEEITREIAITSCQKSD